VRLFSALWVPPAAAAGLRAVLAATGVPPGWRAVDPDTWHLTLSFHGDADPEPLARALDGSVAGLPAPRLRLRGAGRFPGVCWAGVQAEPVGRLTGLVAAAGGEPAAFVPHVTVWRGRERGPGTGTELPGWSEHHGPWWRPVDVLLVRSDLGDGRAHCRVVHRARLGPG
jgi:RNA 2',3'-cyclic 3'-phosphodiesterase